MTIFNREPALILAALNALIALGVGFGLKLTPQQAALINAAVVAILGLWTRSKVSPLDPRAQSVDLAKVGKL